MTVLKNLVGVGITGNTNFPPGLVSTLSALSIIHYLSYCGFLKGWVYRFSPKVFAMVCGLFVALLLATAQVEYRPFIYFQF